MIEPTPEQVEEAQIERALEYSDRMDAAYPDQETYLSILAKALRSSQAKVEELKDKLGPLMGSTKQMLHVRLVEQENRAAQAEKERDSLAEKLAERDDEVLLRHGYENLMKFQPKGDDIETPDEIRTERDALAGRLEKAERFTKHVLTHARLIEDWLLADLAAKALEEYRKP